MPPSQEIKNYNILSLFNDTEDDGLCETGRPTLEKVFNVQIYAGGLGNPLVLYQKWISGSNQCLA